MPTFLTLTDDSGHELKFLLSDDTSPQNEGLAPAGNAANEIKERFDDYFDPLRHLADQLAAKIESVKVKPDEFEVSVGVKLTSEAGIVFAKAGAGAEMSMKMVWKNDR